MSAESLSQVVQQHSKKKRGNWFSPRAGLFSHKPPMNWVKLEASLSLTPPPHFYIRVSLRNNHAWPLLIEKRISLNPWECSASERRGGWGDNSSRYRREASPSTEIFVKEAWQIHGKNYSRSRSGKILL